MAQIIPVASPQPPVQTMMASDQRVDATTPSIQVEGRRDAAASPPMAELAKTAVIKQGYLAKKGHIRRNWKTRWFVLSRCSLNYYNTREDKHPKGSIKLIGASLTCLPSKNQYKRPWVLKLTTVESTDYLIEAPDQRTREEWQTVIEDCVRKLDPSKLNEDERKVSSRSLNQTLTRSIYAKSVDQSVLEQQREIVVAMQDSDAGVPLHEIKVKGRKDSYKYFTGKDGIDWLVSWFFASSRESGKELAGSMLRNGFFHPLVTTESDKLKTCKGSTIIAFDRSKSQQFEDSETAQYIFVIFAPKCVNLFTDSEAGDYDDDEDDPGWLSDTSSSSPSPNIRKRRAVSLVNNISVNSLDSSTECSEENIIRSGFLLKKGHVRRNWKARIFVLRENATHLYYYRRSKLSLSPQQYKKPQGAIPLHGLTVSLVSASPAQPFSVNGDIDSSSSPTNNHKPRQLSVSYLASKPNLFSLLTSSGIIYYLQAASTEERDSWMSDIKREVDRLNLS